MNKFFFFKQKTAYEMRISDWSSDVCSSDLRQDSNLRPSGPKPDALPGCATPRGRCALAAFIPMWQPEKHANGIWWARRDSNPQPSRYERPALPLRYRPPPVEGSPIADSPHAVTTLRPKYPAARLPANTNMK